MQSPVSKEARKCKILQLALRVWRDMRSGQGALARRHTDGPLWSPLLKTTATCEVWRRRTIVLWILLQLLRPFTSPRIIPDTDTGTGPIPPVTVFRVKAYIGGVLARALPEGLRYLSTWAWLSSDTLEQHQIEYGQDSSNEYQWRKRGKGSASSNVQTKAHQSLSGHGEL